MKNILQDIKDNCMLMIVLVSELLIIGSLVLSLFASPKALELVPADFGFENAGLIFRPDSQDDFMVSRELELTSGAYEVSVCYSLQGDIPENVTDVVGRIELDSAGNAAGLKAGTIVLNAGDKCQTSTIWVGYGAKLEDLKVYIRYAGKGRMEIQSMVFREVTLYRFTRLIGFLLLFLLADGLYLVFFTQSIDISVDKKEKLLFFAGMLAASSLPVFCNNIYYGHDIDFHMNRIVSIANELSYGHFPVRLHSDMLNGYGYVTSLFYGDTMLYIPALLYLAKVPLGQCWQMYILINNALTIVFSYICFKGIAEKEKYALVGVFLYVLAPYRLINIYTRAAVGEFTAMTFFPLIALGFWNIYTKENARLRDYLPAVVGLSGVVQSHVISTEMVAIFIAMLCLVNLRQTIKPGILWCMTKTAVLTVLLSAWFLVPMLDSMSMNINVTGRIGRMQEQGLYPAQLVSLFFSGVGKSLKNTTQGEMGFSLGPALCIGIVLALCVYAEYKTKKIHSVLEKGVIICLGMGIIALLFASRFFPWDTLACRSNVVAKYLCMIQYPWRYLAIATILISIASVGALALLRDKWGATKARAILCAMILLCVISTGFYYYHFTYESNMRTVLSETDCNQFYIGDEEYLLRGTEKEALQVRTIKHTADVEVAELGRVDGNYTYICQNKSDMEQELLLPILNYEHYVVKDIEKGMIFDIINGENNCISVLLPPRYEGNITVLYRERRIWRLCEVISFMTVFGLAFMGIGKFRGIRLKGRHSHEKA